jgi:hypothetical protein
LEQDHRRYRLGIPIKGQKMKNKFSDIDKVIMTAWLFFGAGMGVLVAPLFHVSFWVTGTIGLFAGVFVDYVLFFEPWRRKYGLFAYSEQTDEDPVEEEEPDLSEFIRDSFEAEGIDPEADIEFKVSEDDVESDPYEDNGIEETEELIETDFSVESEEEIEDSEDEDDESDVIDVDEEALKESVEEDELEEQETIPALYESKNQMHSSYDKYESNGLQESSTWMKPAPLLMILAGVWFLISGYISGNYPEVTRSITGHFPSWFFNILPIFFLIGLSGLIDLLFRVRDETLEMSSKEHAEHLFNFVKIFAGWGIGFYAILVNL